MIGIETPRRHQRQQVLLGLMTIVLIHTQQLLHTRLAHDRLGQAGSAQSPRQGIADAAQPLGTHSQLGQSAIVRRQFQVFQRGDAQPIVNLSCQLRTDPGNAEQLLFGCDTKLLVGL